MKRTRKQGHKRTAKSRARSPRRSIGIITPKPAVVAASLYYHNKKNLTAARSYALQHATMYSAAARLLKPGWKPSPALTSNPGELLLVGLSGNPPHFRMRI